MRRALGLACALLSLSLLSTRARAQCTTTPLWTYDITGQTQVEPVMSDSSFSGEGLTFIAAGPILTAVWSETTAMHTGGTARWSIDFSPATIVNSPMPVPLSFGGGESVYVALDSARVVRVEAATGTVLATSAALRRAACATDTLSASPAIQLWDFSNAAFQATYAHDMVYIPTRTMCSDTTQNRVYGLRATDLATLWEFNANPYPNQIDYASEGCTIDYDRNSIYCGTNRGILTTLRTLWSIDTLTGAMKWGVNHGALRNRPALNAIGTRLYTSSAYAVTGGVRAINPDTGAAYWTRTFGLLDSFTRNPWVETRPPYSNWLFVAMTSTGDLRAMVDEGTTWSDKWNITSSNFTTLAALSPGDGRFYVGTDSGTVQERNLVDGSLRTTLTISAGAVSYDPALDSTEVGGLNRLMGIANGRTQRYCVPLP